MNLCAFRCQRFETLIVKIWSKWYQIWDVFFASFFVRLLVDFWWILGSKMPPKKSQKKTSPGSSTRPPRAQRPPRTISIFLLFFHQVVLNWICFVVFKNVFQYGEYAFCMLNVYWYTKMVLVPILQFSLYRLFFDVYGCQHKWLIFLKNVFWCFKNVFWQCWKMFFWMISH